MHFFRLQKILSGSLQSLLLKNKSSSATPKRNMVSVTTSAPPEQLLGAFADAVDAAPSSSVIASSSDRGKEARRADADADADADGDAAASASASASGVLLAAAAGADSALLEEVEAVASQQRQQLLVKAKSEVSLSVTTNSRSVSIDSSVAGE